VPTALDESAIDKPRVFVNGGQRGLQLELRPDDIVAVLKPIVAALTA
jgi:Cys-tRNA(Pro)/Cys-tRNA(Cys) deacylase